jgi:hypothetical protein
MHAIVDSDPYHEWCMPVAMAIKYISHRCLLSLLKNALRRHALVEHANSTLQASISRYIDGKEPDRWEEELHKSVYAINACAQASTRFSPFYLETGLQPRIPLSMDPAVTAEAAIYVSICIQDVQQAQLPQRFQALNTVHSKVLGNVKLAQERQRRRESQDKDKG